MMNIWWLLKALNIIITDIHFDISNGIAIEEFLLRLLIQLYYLGDLQDDWNNIPRQEKQLLDILAPLLK